MEVKDLFSIKSMDYAQNDLIHLKSDSDTNKFIKHCMRANIS